MWYWQSFNEILRFTQNDENRHSELDSESINYVLSLG